MATALLEDLAIGSVVFIDSNIFVYAFDGRSAECRNLLARCTREELVGVTLYEIVNEATHALMLGEAKSKGLITTGGASALREKFRLIPELTEYWRHTERILAINRVFLTTDDAILRAAQAERQEAGLLTRDSMIAACRRQISIKFLATSDQDFERVRGITVYCPSDLR